MASMASTTAGFAPKLLRTWCAEGKAALERKRKSREGEREHGESKNSHSLTTGVTPEAQLLKVTRSREDF